MGNRFLVPSVVPGGMTLLSETVANANSSLSLSSIPGTYKQLLLIWSGIQHSTGSTNFGLRFNNSSASTYVIVGERGIATKASILAAGTSIVSTNVGLLGYGASEVGTPYQANGQILIDNYASTTKTKFYSFNSYFYDQTNVITTGWHGTGFFNDTTAITSLDFVRTTGTATFTNHTNTSIRLYGIS